MFLCCMYFEDLFFPACGHFVPHLCEAGKVWGEKIGQLFLHPTVFCFPSA